MAGHVARRLGAAARPLAPWAFLVAVVVLLDGLAATGTPWVLLPLLPAGYGLGRLLYQAVTR